MKRKGEIASRGFKKQQASERAANGKFIKKPTVVSPEIVNPGNSLIIAEGILRAQTKRFLLVLAGCLTKCGNKRRAASVVSRVVFDYTTAQKKQAYKPTIPLKEEMPVLSHLVGSLLPTIKNRKQHMGRKLHFIPLPFHTNEQVNAPVKLATHWFYQALLKNRMPVKLRFRLLHELQSIEEGTSEVLKKKIATYRTALDAKPSIRFYRFLKKL